jgi:hypothetical protein
MKVATGLRTVPALLFISERTDMNCECTDFLALKIWDRSTIVVALDVMVQDLAMRARTTMDHVEVSRTGPDIFTTRLVGEHSCDELHLEVPC